MPASRPLRDRLLEKVVEQEGCWIFGGATANSGYGRIGVQGRTLQAHRASYEVFIGKIPDGLHIDHLCNRRRCINPEHLEAVSQRENNRRAGALRVSNVTHCKRGHEFTSENTFIHAGGGRQCRTCHNWRGKAARRGLTLADFVVLLGGTPQDIGEEA